MPIEYDIIEDKQIVVAKGSGVVTGKDVISHLDALAADDRYTPPMKKLVDYRTIESMTISKEEATKIALKKDIFSSKFHKERCAFVTPKDISYEASRVHQALLESSDINTGVFRNMEEALKWLEVTLDKKH